MRRGRLGYREGQMGGVDALRSALAESGVPSVINVGIHSILKWSVGLWDTPGVRTGRRGRGGGGGRNIINHILPLYV